MSAEFLTVATAAERAACHPDTLRDALRSGDLHGTQRVKGGTWKIRPACIDAWVEGEPCEHALPAPRPVSLATYASARRRGGAA